MMIKVFLLIIMMFVVGCSSEQPVEPAGVNAESEATEVAAALAELSPKDREAAIAQKVCPVSDQELGSMGKPIKVTVEGQDIFVCCAGCIDELKTNFSEYQAMLTK